jgi:hypothetical protein
MNLWKMEVNVEKGDQLSTAIEVNVLANKAWPTLKRSKQLIVVTV